MRFIGATLWTDFLLEGIAGEAWAHLEAGQGLSDFTGAIRHRGDPDGLFTTSESARRHTEHRAFIEAELEQAERSGLTPVVITHHAPSPRCIRPWFEKSRLNPGFAPDLDSMIARYQPTLWVHRHMHDRIEERLGETRVVCNPGGYNRVEGHEFDPVFVVELRRTASSPCDANSREARCAKTNKPTQMTRRGRWATRRCSNGVGHC